MRTNMAIACVSAALVFTTEARAQEAQVGDTVECSMSAGASSITGTVIAIEPRPGWDEPWYIVRAPMASSTYDYKCLPRDIRAAAAAPPPRAPATPARRATPARPTAPAAAAPAGGAQCRPGAKLEGLYGNNWYAVTVLAGPDANGWCPVRFDGYGAFNDRSVPELRPRGSGPITRPERPVPDGPAPGRQAGGAVPDGTYSCSKIEGGGGNYLHMGTATIRGGRVTGLGLPEGWTVVSVARGAPNAWSNTVAEVTYRTRGGDTDKLECIPQ